jgi:hypothetical protein
MFFCTCAHMTYLTNLMPFECGLQHAPCLAWQVSPAPATPDPQAVAAAADAISGTGGLVAAAAGGQQPQSCFMSLLNMQCMGAAVGSSVLESCMLA